MDDRVTRVEEKIAYLEQFVGELDGVVRELHENLDAVRREVARLHDRLEQDPRAPRNADGDDPDDLEAHKPPHY